MISDHYYFHGTATVYTLEDYDNGLDTVPKIHHDASGPAWINVLGQPVYWLVFR
jgi:hypothetical protein